ncbi:hypothetical protein CR513_03654, partial [Mucuna pruriens]
METKGYTSIDLLHSKDIIMITRIEYEKVHSYKSSKEMWDTLALAYEGTSHVKDSKISILVHQYKLFKMEDHERIDQILLGQCRPLIIAIIVSKNLKKLPIKELFGTLKKFMRLNLERMKANKKGKDHYTKAFKLEESSDEVFEEGFDEDELFFIYKKIHSMLKKKRESKWKNH